MTLLPVVLPSLQTNRLPTHPVPTGLTSHRACLDLPILHLLQLSPDAEDTGPASHSTGSCLLRGTHLTSAAMSHWFPNVQALRETGARQASVRPSIPSAMTCSASSPCYLSSHHRTGSNLSPAADHCEACPTCMHSPRVTCVTLATCDIGLSTDECFPLYPCKVELSL